MTKRTKKENIGITIRSEPETTGKRKAAELPLHILFVSDLTPRVKPPTDWSLQSHLFGVEKQTFPQLMQQLAPSLNIEVPDHISGGPKPVEFELQFKDLKTFGPEAVVAQVPALSRLLHVKLLVEKVKRGELPLSEFKSRAEAAGLDSDLAQRFQELLTAPPMPTPPIPPPSTSPAQDSKAQEKEKLGSLLQMVDLGDGVKPEKKPDAMDALLSAITASETGPGSEAPTPQGTLADVERAVAEMLIADLDQMVGDQVNAILHHPQFQSLETSWRGLKFLVDRIDFRKNIRLSVLSAPRAHLNNALYHQLLKPPSGAMEEVLTETPVSVVVADFEFGSTTNELEILSDLTEIMASLQVPLVAGVGPAFFGKGSPSEIAQLPVLWQHFQGPEYARWNSLQDQAASNYVTLALPRFLLRFPYGPDNPVKGFQFTESLGQRYYLWGNAALAVATTLARSFVETGWPTHITGPRSGGRVEDLPLWEEPAAGGRARIPLDVRIPEEKQVELSEMGFIVLACRPNDDAAYVAFAPTIHRPEKYDNTESNEDARIHATLACQMMVARILQHLLRFEREMTPGLSPSRVREELVDSMRTLLKVGGKLLPRNGIEVETSEPSEHPGRLPLRIRLISPPEILGREVNIVMAFELSRR